jgi:CBS domain-containing protein
MIPILELLKGKGGDIWTIAPEASVYEAAKMMDEKGISALPVVKDDKLVGIISDRDCTRRVMVRRLNPDKTKVKDVMSQKVITVTPHNTLEDCMQLIHSKRLRHLPVMDGEKLIGLVSIGDVLKEKINVHEATIKHLENYITGKA